MQRGSDRLSVHRDEEMKHELRGLLRSGHPTRSAEWHDPEPPAEDDPQIWGGPVVPGSPQASPATVRQELGRILGRGSFPADPRELSLTLRRRNAPDTLVDAVHRLPHRKRYANAAELAEAVVENGR